MDGGEMVLIRYGDSEHNVIRRELSYQKFHAIPILR
jgi:hypothetical protein